MAAIIPAAAKYARRFRRIEEEIRLRRAFETRSREEIRAYQLERFNRLWLSSIQTVPYYQDLARRMKLPERFSSLDEVRELVPVLEKASIQDHPERFLSAKRKTGFWKLTGGSTGTPMRCFRSHRAHLEGLWDRDYGLASWGIGAWDRSAFIDGHVYDLGGSLKNRLLKANQSARDRLRRRVRLSGYFLDDSRLRRFYEKMRRGRVALFYSYPSAAYLMAQAVEGRPPIETLRLAVTFAEAATDDQRKTIGRAFGVPVATEYSTIEMGYVAGSHGDGRVRIAEHGLIFETLPAPDGRHDIILTDLRNPAFPLIRYRIMDGLAAPPEHGSAGCAWIGPVEGRKVDLLRTRSGRTFHGNAVLVILKEYAFIKIFQVVQENLDEILVRIQSDVPEDDTRLDEPTRRLSAVFGGELSVRIKPVPRLETTAAGKHRLIICRVPPAGRIGD